MPLAMSVCTECKGVIFLDADYKSWRHSREWKDCPVAFSPEPQEDDIEYFDYSERDERRKAKK